MAYWITRRTFLIPMNQIVVVELDDMNPTSVGQRDLKVAQLSVRFSHGFHGPLWR